MSYVYMKSLENKAEKYDRGIKLLTLGKLPKIKQFIVDNYLEPKDRLLDIGMGTGTFAVVSAKKGINVIGIDYSENMLEVAQNRLKNERLEDLIKIIKMPVVDIDENFQDKSFDKITAILSFSEFYRLEQEYVLEQIYRILRDEGEFIIVDEVKPKKFLKRVLYNLIRVPLVLITFLKSHVTTKALKNLEKRLEEHKFQIIEERLYLLDTLKLIRVKKVNKE